MAEHKSETAEIEILHGKKNLSEEFAEHRKVSTDGHVIGWLSSDVVADAIEWAKNYNTGENPVKDLIEETAWAYQSGARTDSFMKETERLSEKRLASYKKQDDEITNNLYKQITEIGKEFANRGVSTHEVHIGKSETEPVIEEFLGGSSKTLKEMSRKMLEGGRKVLEDRIRGEEGTVRFIGVINRNDKSNLEEYEGDELVFGKTIKGIATGERKFKSELRTLDPTLYSTENPLELKYYYDYSTFPTHGYIILGEYYQNKDNPIAILDFKLEENNSVGTLSLTDVNKQKRYEFQVNLDSDVRLIISKIEFIGYDLLVYVNVEGKEEDEKVVFPLDTKTIKRILTYKITD
ncbi:hypothetical protein RBTH_07748 [Bacillus thuringiensis serovar israelensis ATCC 35646]|nr:hypothetical protein RBTH_07748 [Bacillus thuringiensis serovar israelensis ATCC 35646]